MRSIRPLAAPARRLLAAIAVGLYMTAIGQAEEPSRYRDYLLGSELASILRATGSRAADVKTLHERPSLIQTLEWQAPYARPGAEEADPVESVVFAFVDGQLYQITVDYDRPRIAGLTTADLVAGVEAVYGPRVPSTQQKARADTMPEGTVVLGRWGDDRATVTLVRGPFEEIRLLVRSTTLGPIATRAIVAAQAQDVAEAPARQAAAEALAAAEEQAERTRNRSAFKP